MHSRPERGRGERDASVERFAIVRALQGLVDEKFNNIRRGHRAWTVAKDSKARLAKLSNNNFEYFNARDFVTPGVRAVWLQCRR